MRIFIVLLPVASGHYALQHPPTWQDANAAFHLSPGNQCSASCTGQHAVGQKEQSQGCVCEWYTNYTLVEKPTWNSDSSPLRTYHDYNGVDLWTHMPWRAPGTAPIWSPCGIDGGNLQGCPVGNPSPYDCAGGGYGHGPDALHTDFPGVMITEWKAGSVVEAFWGITANHGGGYQYRLAKMPAEGKGALTEEMFQQTPLKFHGDDQYVQFGEDYSKRVHFKAVQTTEGTWPAGSMWRRNPIPACKGPSGGSGYPPNPCNFKDTSPSDDLFQFPPPAKSLNPGEKLGGFGNYNGDGGSHPGGTMAWSIVDQLEVPNLEPGDYVLSARWDSEQTPQVWNTCASIRITAADTEVV